MSRIRLPPGPQYALLDPRLAPFAIHWLRDPYAALLRTAARYGDLAYVKMGPVRMCLLNHPQYVKEVLITRQRQFVKGGAFHLARSILGQGLLTSDGDFHLRQRRLAQPAFHPQRMSHYADIMVRAARDLRAAWQSGQTVDLFREMSHLTLTIACEALFGAQIAGRTDDVRLAFTDVLHTWKHALLPLAHVLDRYSIPVPAGRRFRRAKAKLDAILYRLIADKRAVNAPGNDLLSLLAHATDDEGRMTDEQLRDEAMTFMLAGHETMATTLSWTWILLSQHPEVATTLAAEVHRELGDRTATYGDLPRLVYARKVFAETLRLYPALWGFSRRALEDIPLGPYVIPKNSQVLASPFVVHRNPEIYPNPLRFDPDRWADDESFDTPDLSYFPFGGGVRRCMGEPFAWAEGPLVLATLTQRWRLQLDPRNSEVKPAPSFICRPQGVVRMTVVPSVAEQLPTAVPVFA